MPDRSWRGLCCAFLLGIIPSPAAQAGEDGATDAVWLPTGQLVTPTAAAGARLQALNPHLADFPDFTADHAASMALSPDRRTLLVLTSGFNRIDGSDGKPIPKDSNEYVFVFELSSGAALQRQAIPISNSFAGIAFAPDGQRFYVGGGADDDVHVFGAADGRWAETAEPIRLGHAHGEGMPGTRPATAGLAVSADGSRLVVADFGNDAISIVDLASRQIQDLDLRPGKLDPARHGAPGGTFPYGVAVEGNGTAFVSSLRDREVVVARIAGAPAVLGRIAVPGNPNAVVLSRDGSRLYVALDNADAVAVVDTAKRRLIATVAATAPPGLLAKPAAYRGAAPNALALSEDGTRLYVSEGGANALAVIALDRRGTPVTGLIPTGWYPDAVAVAGATLYVANAKGVPGPNPRNCNAVQVNPAEGLARCVAGNNYVEQLEKASLLSLPVPHEADLDALTRRVAANDGYGAADDPRDGSVMRQLRQRIRHVIYLVKENRTYDQVLGDLGTGNGDPHLTEFGRAITPNHHALAEGFVALDNFHATGEVSGNGWPWSTEARESDIGEKEVPVVYARRGLSYDVEGTDRGVVVALPTPAARRAANPETPDDPDILAGTADVAAPDPPKGPKQQGYLWDAALRAGLTVRNYGFFLDLGRYDPKGAAPVPVTRMPAEDKTTVAFPVNPTLAPVTDPYFRGFDNKLPDYYREREWAREFDRDVAAGRLPALSLVRLMHDHFGDFGLAIDGVDTPEAQMADNDYALGLLVQKVATSPVRDSTLIFVVEDDAQDGPDHVDAHRTIAFVAGPYVKQHAVVSRRYTTVNLLRTIEDVLGIEQLSLFDAYQPPMTDVFDLAQRTWSFTAHAAAVLRSTQLPIRFATGAAERPAHDSAWWAGRTRGFDFSAEDRLDAGAFNRLLWAGLMKGPYPGAPMP